MRVLRSIASSDFLNRNRLKLFKNFNVYFKLKRFLPSTFEPLRTSLLCKHYGIDLILDVGANNGQFADQQFIFGYTGEIISFEPSKSAHEKLRKRAEKQDRWKIRAPLAIGAQSGKLEFYEYNDSVFNSFLKVKPNFGKNKRYLQTKNISQVQVTTLDDIINNLENIDSKNFMVKIDTQGYEKQVLDGFQKFVRSASIIKIEIPLKAMYENVHWTFYDTVEYMKELNFHPINLDIEGANANGVVRTIDMSFLNLAKHEL